MIFGNGGSAAIASHFSVDLTKNAKIRCTNYNESDLLTCFSNDFGYEKWVEKAIEYYGDEGDVFIGISSFLLILLLSFSLTSLSLDDPPTKMILFI